MTPEQQRIAIAKACGEINPRTTEFGGCVATAFVTKDGVHVGFHGVPDYLRDLNAMHEAERTLTDNQRMHFRGELVEMMRPKYKFESACLMAIHATAKQRAKAFLRTLNLWKE